MIIAVFDRLIHSVSGMITLCVKKQMIAQLLHLTAPTISDSLRKYVSKKDNTLLLCLFSHIAVSLIFTSILRIKHVNVQFHS